MKSLGSQIKQLAGLLDTPDLTPWEQKFIADMGIRTNGGELTVALSANQVEKIEQIYTKHFGDGVSA